MDLHHRPIPDASRIDIANPRELRRWAERLDVEADLLRDAVLQVGDDPEAVELVLKGRVTVARSMH